MIRLANLKSLVQQKTWLWRSLHTLLLVVGALPHELCHYVVARLLGVRVRLSLDHVLLKGDSQGWRLVAILLAPAMAGVALLGAFGLWMWLNPPVSGKGQHWLTMLVGGAVFAWWGGCADDLFCVTFFAVRRRWPIHMRLRHGRYATPSAELRGILRNWRDSLRTSSDEMILLNVREMRKNQETRRSGTKVADTDNPPRLSTTPEALAASEPLAQESRMLRITFIRHAESAANAGLRSSNPAAIPLTPRGREQAQALARDLTEAPDLLIVSPYHRAQQTAQPLRERFPQTSYEVWPVQEFTYLAPARCVGTTAAERRPLILDYWRRGDPHYCDGEGAETFADLMGRVEAMLERLKRVEAGYVIVVTHGQFMRAVVWRLLIGTQTGAQEAMQPFWAFCAALDVPNGAQLDVRFEGRQWGSDRQWICLWVEQAKQAERLVRIGTDCNFVRIGWSVATRC
jgi:broad specificity phosphatase PhoE